VRDVDGHVLVRSDVAGTEGWHRDTHHTAGRVSRGRGRNAGGMLPEPGEDEVRGYGDETRRPAEREEIGIAAGVGEHGDAGVSRRDEARWGWKPACEALPGRAARRLRGTGRVAPRIRVQPSCLGEPGAPGQLIGLISGVMTGVTAGAIIGFIGAAALIAGLRFAAFFLAGFFFFLAAFLAGFLFLEAFFFDFFATRFFDARFLDDFFFAFLAFLEDFFFAAFFFAAMCIPFNVDRVSVVREARPGLASHYQAFGTASNKLVSRFYAECARVKRDYLIRLAAFW